MSDEFGNNFITVTDDDGEEFELEHLDTVEFGGEVYMAFLPADIDEDDEDFGLVILKAATQDDEEVLAVVDDEAQLEAVHALFLERLIEDGEEQGD